MAAGFDGTQSSSSPSAAAEASPALTRDRTYTERIASVWQRAPELQQWIAAKMVQARAVTPDQIEVSVSVPQHDSATVVAPLLEWLSARPEVHWVAEKAKIRLLNDHARYVIQDAVPGSFRVWEHGLKGQGQVIAISDTG